MRTSYLDDARPKRQVLDGLLLIDFDHARGPIVSMSWPSELQYLKGLEDIAFYALPDRIHEQDNDIAAFHICVQRPNKTSWETIFGLSAIRRIDTAALIDKPENVTRNTVQKAVVVLSNKPLFGRIIAKIKMATAAFFKQLSFQDDSILAELRLDIASAIDSGGEDVLTSAESVRDLILRYRANVLVAVKTLLLQRSVLFYGAPPVERLVAQQYALLALIPGELSALQNSSSPLLPSDDCMLSNGERDSKLSRDGRRISAQNEFGLPLRLFEKGRMFSPLVPLQHVELLDDSISFLAGTTNTLIAHRRGCIKVNVDVGSFEMGDLPGGHLSSLTAADRKWMEGLCKTVCEFDPSSIHFDGSDDWIVNQFRDYIHAMLSAVKEAESIAAGGLPHASNNTSGAPRDNLSDFGKEWIAAWMRTEAAQHWSTRVSSNLYENNSPRHPAQAQASSLQDVGLRIQDGLQQLHVTENLSYAKDNISHFLTARSTNIRQLYGVAGTWGKGILVKPAQTGSVAQDDGMTKGGSFETRQGSDDQVGSAGKASLALSGIGSFFSRGRTISSDQASIQASVATYTTGSPDLEKRPSEREMVALPKRDAPNANGMRTLRLASQTSPRPSISKESRGPHSPKMSTGEQGLRGPKPLLLSAQNITSANAGRRRMSSQTHFSETTSAPSETGSVRDDV